MAIIGEYVQTAEPVGSRVHRAPPLPRPVAGDDPQRHGRPRGHGLPVPAAHHRRPRAHRQGLSLLRGPPRADAVDGGARSRATGARRPRGSIPPSRSWRMRRLRLSQLTRMTGMLLAPPLKHTTLARIDLVALEDDRALAVIVTDTGWVTARPISAPRARHRGAARDRPRARRGATAARRSPRSWTTWPRPPIRSIRSGPARAR